MTAQRSTKEEKRYSKHRKTNVSNACPFCDVNEDEPRYVEETKHLKVIRNTHPYSIWDGQGVTDHLMIIPKRHTDRLGELSAEGATEYIKLVDKYESMGYNLYARAPASTIKSVTHQHTHLIKPDHINRRFVFLLRKPFYIRLSYK